MVAGQQLLRLLQNELIACCPDTGYLHHMPTRIEHVVRPSFSFSSYPATIMLNFNEWNASNTFAATLLFGSLSASYSTTVSSQQWSPCRAPSTAFRIEPEKTDLNGLEFSLFSSYTIDSVLK